jgi:3-phenylpropionate/trans-cinnamate dioxygenase ferredoxin component
MNENRQCPAATLPEATPTSTVGLRDSLHVTPLVDICQVSELPPGEHRVVEIEDLEIAVVNCNGDILAIEDRCSHDDGDLMEGDIDFEACTVECPRHGSVFNLRTGQPENLPAYVPIDTFRVLVEGQMIRVEVD